MDDILDSIEDLELEDQEEDFSGEVIEVDDSMISDVNDIIESSATMSREEAEDLTTAIRSTSDALYILLARAHDGKAYRILGYNTWKEYVQTEFEISPQTSYRLLDMSRVIRELEQATPEGTKVKLTQAQAIAIKKELPRITDEVREATEGKTAEEAEDFLEEMMKKKKEQQKEDKKAIDAKEKSLAEAEADGISKGLEMAADAFLEEHDGKETNKDSEGFTPDAPDNITSSADGEFIDVQIKGEGGVSPEVMYVLSNLSNMAISSETFPDPEVIVDAVPGSSLDQMYDQITSLQEYVNRLATLLEERKYRESE